MGALPLFNIRYIYTYIHIYILVPFFDFHFFLQLDTFIVFHITFVCASLFAMRFVTRCLCFCLLGLFLNFFFERR